MSLVFDPEIFKTFVGGEYDFYGVDNHVFCLGINDKRIVLEAREDPDDGYRSYFDTFVIQDLTSIFHRHPIARVRLEACAKNDAEISGWSLTDVGTGHVWLLVGTDYSEIYYPQFVFRYEPDPSRVVEGV